MKKAIHKKANPKNAKVLITPGSWTSEIEYIIASFGAKVRVLEPGGIVAQYRWATHLLLTGGGDIHPSLYQEKNRHSLHVNPDRDAVEFALASQALTDGKPVMGICRGHQMLAVAAGGRLVQDIKAELDKPDHKSGGHSVLVSPRSLLSKVLGQEFYSNSFHHQAVAKAPPGWRTCAVSEDGVIESIELPGHPVVSVQWHPEVLEDETSGRLFGYFLGLRGAA